MQKFRNYIYIDYQRVESYLNQIPELKKSIKSKSYESQASIEGGFDVKLAKTDTSLNAKSVTNYEIKETNIENIIDWAYEFGNAINYSGEELSIGDKDNLIILNGKVTIPEISQNLELLNSLSKQPSLLNLTQISEENKEKISIIKESDNIPILLETESDYIFNFSLQKNNFIQNHEDFMDSTDEEINVIGRIDKIYNSNEEIEIFNLAKEIFKLNRSAIRNMAKNDLKEMILTEKGPLVKITPIIIYR